MKTRIIHTKIHFEDDWFNTLPIVYRYLFIYLFTNSHIGQTGIYNLSKRVALLETRASEKDWNKATAKFEKDGKIKIVGDWICVRNAEKYSNYSGSKNEVAYKNELNAIPIEIRDTLSIPYRYPIDTPINNKSEIINKKPEIGNRKSPTQELREKAHALVGKHI